MTALVEAADEALVHERDQPRRARPRRAAVQPSGDRLHRLDASGREDREQPEGRPLVVVQEALAPLDRAPQGLLPLREVAGVAAEDAGVLAQPVAQLARREQRDPGGRELDREGQPVEPSADLGHGLGVVVGAARTPDGPRAPARRTGSPPPSSRRRRRTRRRRGASAAARRTRRSPRIRSASRLVTRTRRPGLDRSSSAMPSAASITCSRLSSSSSTRRVARCSRKRSSGPPLPDAPTARATASNAASASVTGERSTK